ncbi:MAG: class I SAM-dependent methyltransferase [Candidatus Shapirobacteria bacterium]|nr:class I SAM-dependent methyltransferase [Candidatus Shapirobacteria bacterium]
MTKSGGEITVCRRCGFIGKFSDPSYSGYHQDRYGYKMVRDESKDPMLQKIKDENFIKEGMKVLDYGCGAGDYSHFIYQITEDIIGADINIEIAEKRFPEINFKLIDPSKERLIFPANSFDVILAVNVIEVHDFDNLLSEFKRILRKNGTLFITTYDANFVLHPILNDPTHVYEWSEVEFTKLISGEFKMIKSFKYGSFFNYYPWNKIIVKFLKPELCAIAEKKSQ